MPRNVVGAGHLHGPAPTTALLLAYGLQFPEADNIHQSAEAQSRSRCRIDKVSA